MDWINIVDSAVKIGLGSLIAASAAYFTLIRTQKHKQDEVLLERRCKGVERVAEMVEAYAVAVGKLISRMRFISSRHGGDAAQVTDDMRDSIKDVDTIYVAALHELNVATSRLRLIGAPDLAEKLAAGIKSVSVLRNSFFNDRQLHARLQIDACGAEFKAAMSEFYVDLSKVYLGK